MRLKSCLPISAILALGLGATGADAGSLNLDFRADVDAVDYNDAHTGKYDSTGIIIHTGRVDWQGKLNENLSFRFRPRFDQVKTNDGIDKLTTGVDFAYIQHRMDRLVLTIGKMATDIALHENLAGPPDVYLRSEALNAISVGYKLPSDTTQEMLYATKFMTGVRLAHEWDQHELAILALNNPEADQATPANVSGQTQLLYGATYKGKFLEKTLQPVLSYHATKLGGDVSQDETEDTQVRYLAAGVKYDVPDWFAQADYGVITATDVNAAGDMTDGEIKSLAVEAGVKHGQWVARLKVEKSQVSAEPTTAAAVEQDIMGYGAAIEFKPWLDQNFRYHLAYTMKEISESGVDDKTETHIIAGVRILADFLKE